MSKDTTKELYNLTRQLGKMARMSNDIDNIMDGHPEKVLERRMKKEMRKQTNKMINNMFPNNNKKKK